MSDSDGETNERTRLMSDHAENHSYDESREPDSAEQVANNVDARGFSTNAAADRVSTLPVYYLAWQQDGSIGSPMMVFQ